MYIKQEDFFLFCALIVALIQLIRDMYKDNNKKR